MQHRCPMPGPLFRAMVATAWIFGWRRWAACTAIAFVSPGRIGEILRAYRSELILPADDLAEHAHRAFVRIADPKTAHRGGARVQHLSVLGACWVRLLSSALGDLHDTERLYPFTAATYRSRWDTLLRAFKVPASLRLTPGGLRGGGAVALYLEETPISEILWRMRLQSQTTLAHYLQEVSALSTLRSLPPCSRDAIVSADALFGRLFPLDA